MAVDLSNLIPAIKVAVNAPGTSTLSAEDDEWAERLAGAFWTIRLKSFFEDWRLNEDNEIIPVVEGGDDMPRELQQLVVIMASITAIEGRLLDLDTDFRAKSGEDEFEVRKSASVLQELLKQKRAELNDLRDLLVTTPSLATGVGVVDMLGVRLGDSRWVA